MCSELTCHTYKPSMQLLTSCSSHVVPYKVIDNLKLDVVSDPSINLLLHGYIHCMATMPWAPGRGPGLYIYKTTVTDAII